MNAKDKKGNTPLHLAAENALMEVNVEIVRDLVSRGADVHAKNKEGQTPLQVATTKSKSYPGAYKEVIKYLISVD